MRLYARSIPNSHKRRYATAANGTLGEGVYTSEAAAL